MESFQKLPKWLKSNVFYRASLSDDSDGPGFDKAHIEVHPLDANLIGSQKLNGKHVLFLDLDQEHFISPSSTPGHSHVYVNADLGLDALKEIIDVLAKYGIVQGGIKNQLDISGFLTFRPPGVKKGDPYDDAGLNEAKAIENKTSNVDDLFGKYQALKDKLQEDYNNTKSDNTSCRVSVAGEILVSFLSNLANQLDLENGKIQVDINSTGTDIVTYNGGEFCKLTHHMYSDTYDVTFYSSNFPTVTWKILVDYIKETFGV